jgi:ferric-dicitrate binding protein FerR (iron transport regulator)
VSRRDDYLWDRTGEPDPEVERLERLLGRFGHEEASPRGVSLKPRWGRFRRLSMAAALLLGVAALALWLGRPTRVPGGPGWDVARLAGAPEVGSAPIADSGRLGVGEWLETDAGSRARIDVPGIGFVEVEPRTRIGLKDTGPAGHRLALERGGMHATVSAPPRLFLVDTPAATAVDLGCSYRLQVDPDGRGLLQVQSGFVALEGQGRETVVPAGASCEMRPGLGPGTPFSDRASGALRSALEALDFEGAAGKLAVVLAEARLPDTLTLWHLLGRVPSEQRGEVYDRLAQLAPPPPAVTRDGVLALDKQMLGLWKEDLQSFW